MDKTYSDAMATIATADKSTLSDLNDKLATFKDAFSALKTDVQAKLDDYPSDGPVIGARATVSAVMSQLSMIDFTVSHIVTIASAELAKYQPATPVATDTTTA